MKKKCRFRYLTELIGFEGQFMHACSHKNHTEFGTIFPKCLKCICPLNKIYHKGDKAIEDDTKLITICDIGKDENGKPMVVEQIDYKLPNIPPEMKEAICNSSGIGCDLDCKNCVVTKIIKDKGLDY